MALLTVSQIAPLLAYTAVYDYLCAQLGVSRSAVPAITKANIEAKLGSMGANDVTTVDDVAVNGLIGAVTPALQPVAPSFASLPNTTPQQGVDVKAVLLALVVNDRDFATALDTAIEREFTYLMLKVPNFEMLFNKAVAEAMKTKLDALKSTFEQALSKEHEAMVAMIQQVLYTVINGKPEKTARLDSNIRDLAEELSEMIKGAGEDSFAETLHKVLDLVRDPDSADGVDLPKNLKKAAVALGKSYQVRLVEKGEEDDGLGWLKRGKK